MNNASNIAMTILCLEINASLNDSRVEPLTTVGTLKNWVLE